VSKEQIGRSDVFVYCGCAASVLMVVVLIVTARVRGFNHETVFPAGEYWLGDDVANNARDMRMTCAWRARGTIQVDPLRAGETSPRWCRMVPVLTTQINTRNHRAETSPSGSQ
jgi:hypothetical protein